MTEEIKSEPIADEAMPAAGTNGINVGGNTVMRSTEHLPTDQRSLIRWAYQYARDAGMSWSDLAEASGIDRSTWWKVFQDRYTNAAGDRVSLDRICARIARWKRLAEQREMVSRKSFVETSVWERINWICDRALVRNKIGFVFGESHTGKTESLLQFQLRNNHGQTVYVEVPPAGGVQLLTKELAKSLHVSHKTCFEKLIENVSEALDRDRLLIVDEIHRVFTTYQKSSVMRCLDVLRWLHDQTNCGMVLCGTNVFRDGLQTGEFSQYLKQLRRRGLYEIQLPDMPPRSDLDMIAESYGLEPASGEAEEVLHHLVKDNGIAVYFTRLDDAREIAAKKKQPMSWDHFVRACDLVARMRMVVG